MPGAAALLFPLRCLELRWEEKHPWQACAGAVGWPGGLCREGGQRCLSQLGLLPGALLCALWSSGSGYTSHAAREPQPPVRNWLVQDKQNHQCMEKAAVYSCGSHANMGGCRQGSQGCLLLLPVLLMGPEAAARCKRLRLQAVAEVACGCRGAQVQVWACVRPWPRAPSAHAGRGSKCFTNAAQPVQRTRACCAGKTCFPAWI